MTCGASCGARAVTADSLTGRLIHAGPRDARILGSVDDLKRSGFERLALARTAERSAAVSAARPEWTTGFPLHHSASAWAELDMIGAFLILAYIRRDAL